MPQKSILNAARSEHEHNKGSHQDFKQIFVNTLLGKVIIHGLSLRVSKSPESLSLHTREYMPGRQDRDDTISAFAFAFAFAFAYAFAFAFAFVHILGVIRADQECSGDTLWVELG